LPEIGRTVGPGEIIGEIGIFSPVKARTASAVCETAVTALVLSHHKVLELYYQTLNSGYTWGG
jgi:CRP/FNR family transcriptional regulator, cyclic AMP receptor protein